MTTRRELLIALGAGALAAPLASFAQQQPAAIPRIGFFGVVSPESSPLLKGFQEGLRELGYIEGSNIRLEVRSTRHPSDRLSEIAAELVRIKTDVIVAYGSTAVEAASKATTKIPIVMVAAGDPVKLRFAASLARPGGNLTGATAISAELAAKRLTLLKEAVPKASRVSVLVNPANPFHSVIFATMVDAAPPLHFTVHSIEARTRTEIERALAQVTRERVETLVVLADSLFVSERVLIADLAAKKRLPTMFTYRQDAEAGGLMAYGPNLPEMFRRAATYVDKILKGAKPGNLPIEQPTKFELVINMKTAKALGIAIPQTLLISADQVID